MRIFDVLEHPLLLILEIGVFRTENGMVRSIAVVLILVFPVLFFFLILPLILNCGSHVLCSLNSHK
jgi:hypothetical protein